jgi:hypothetical protein
MHASTTFEEQFEAAKKAIYAIKTSDIPRIGWSPRLRQSFGYFTPDECYEALLFMLVGPATRWLDVGCGHNLFPTNPNLARVLAERCQLLVGIDPDETIEKNTFVHRRIRGPLEQLDQNEKYDLITLRMVAEHISNADEVAKTLSNTLSSIGNIVIYTVSKWSPSAMVSAATPMNVHHFVKKRLWGTEEEDTFPTQYRMNTRSALKALFARHGIIEDRFLYLDDCRSFSRWKTAFRIELMLQSGLRRLGLRYPELCLLGVYRHAP